jgi:uncharacterized protein (DUF2461 family)
VVVQHAVEDKDCAFGMQLSFVEDRSRFGEKTFGFIAHIQPPLGTHQKNLSGGRDIDNDITVRG